MTPRSVVQIYPPLPKNYTPPSEEIVKTLWSIRNLSENTQKTYFKMLKRLTRNCILNDPMNVENFVFGLDVSNKTRNVFFDAYSHYCRSNRIQWIRSRLKVESYPVKIPTERNIDLVISTATLKYATIFQISKHGLRPDEFSKITLRDIDQDNRTILTPMSHPRAGTRKSSETQL